MMKTVYLPIHFTDLAEIMNNRAVCDVIMLGHTSSAQFPHEMIPHSLWCNYARSHLLHTIPTGNDSITRTHRCSLSPPNQWSELAEIMFSSDCVFVCVLWTGQSDTWGIKC